MSDVSIDRFAGVLVGAACADALGAGYEFGSPIDPSVALSMRGQGAFEPGEWTDDTAQMLAIAMAAVDHDLSPVAGEDAVAALLQEWYLSPARLKDIGIHSSAVFSAVSTLPATGLASRFREAALGKEGRHPGRSGGNGALMRTAPVALALWDEPSAMVHSAMRLASMTHADERSSESCAVWCLAIQRALLGPLVWDDVAVSAWFSDVLTDVRQQLGESSDFWVSALESVHRTAPSDYFHMTPGNGYSVTTLLAALSAVVSTPIPTSLPASHLRLATEAAVRGGGDTDTVACVAGALLGAMWGYSAVPLQWRRRVFGWPGYRDRDLLRVADALHRGSSGVDSTAWPHASDFTEKAGWPHTDSFAVHPHDSEVLLSGIDVAYGALPVGGSVDAVVSLCRVGTGNLDHFALDASDRVEVRLIDQDGDANPHLRLVMEEAADAVAAFRAEGKRVLLHCAAAQSRTPAVAALYSVRHCGVAPEVALAEVLGVLPGAAPRSAFAQVVLSQ